jgi:pyridoxine 5-phosphate synthase
LPTRLSINLNKVALLRNSRTCGYPNVLRAAQLCLAAGCHGITVHPRPDQRHITYQDVAELHVFLKNWPQAEFNIEGNPAHQLMDFVLAYRPHQATFVPDATDQATSDHGWVLDKHEQAQLQPWITKCHEMGVRVSLFMDPIPERIAIAAQLGVDAIELHTASYARAHEQGRLGLSEILPAFVATAQAAQQARLRVHAGHDLTLDNLPLLIHTIPCIEEVSIGHAFISDALEQGYQATVQAYLAACTPEDSPKLEQAQ